MPSVDMIARLKITLERVTPPVMRLIEVPLDLRLDRLHLTLQAAFGWTDTHLWEFRAGGVAWGPRDPYEEFGDEPLDASRATLRDVLEDTGVKTIRYIYDFGDNWQHAIRVGRLGAPDPRSTYPMLLDAQGRCPPEDIGGPFGYAKFLEALADPRHSSRHVDLRERFGEGEFDAAAVDVVAIARKLEALGASWARRRTGARKKPGPTPGSSSKAVTGD
jgi:hypothetical protein